MTSPDAVWLTIESAPKDGTPILVYGQPDNIEMLRFTGPAVHLASWDMIDGAFCLDGGTAIGPFIKPTHWMPLPPPPHKDTQP